MVKLYLSIYDTVFNSIECKQMAVISYQLKTAKLEWPQLENVLYPCIYDLLNKPTDISLNK